MLTKADLHVHLLQSLYPEDVISLAKEKYAEIDWNRFDFLNRYEKTIGVRLDPRGMLEKLDHKGAVLAIENIMVFPTAEAGHFDKFDIRSQFPLCVTGYYLDRNEHDQVVKLVLDRHKREGLTYVEYRQAVGYSDEDKEEWKNWHRRFMKALKESSRNEFKARYIMRINDEMYEAVQEFIAENPDLLEVFVGLDFTGSELPAKTHSRFFDRLRIDNERHPDSALDVVVHVGEVYFDKSIESAIRWCHEYAEFGVKRMAHCIALGLDPEVALARRPDAHVSEPVSERIDQIDYDLMHSPELGAIGVKIDKDKLHKERSELRRLDPKVPIQRAYNKERIAELRLRQDFVLDAVKRLGIVIETCPTSNLLIGGIPSIEDHPFRKFYDSCQKVAICTDDPGIFCRTVSDEVRLVARSLNINYEQLSERIGDPYSHRLGTSRGLRKEMES